MARALGLIVAALGGLAALAMGGRRSGSGAPSSPQEPPAAADPWGTRDDLATGVCEPGAKPGVDAFRRWALATWGGRDGGIARDCALGGRSEHHEGRAWDWMTSIAAGEARIGELLADDAARARAAGVLYLIHNGRIWRAYQPRGWAPYTGPNPHTDHVHFSFTRDGAGGRTSFYTTGEGRAFMPGGVA